MKSRRKFGSMRLQHQCPCCGARCLVRSSASITNRTRESYVQCTNAMCGWTGIISSEVTRTISAPSPHYQGADIPPPVSEEFFQKQTETKSL